MSSSMIILEKCDENNNVAYVLSENNVALCTAGGVGVNKITVQLK